MITDVIEWAVATGCVAGFFALMLLFPIHPVPTSPKCRCPTCKPMREAFRRWERGLAATREQS
jgi:hypothetical protein